MDNRLVLVTGGIGSIGTAICVYLASLGIKVVAADLADNDRAEQWQKSLLNQGVDIGFVHADITNFDSCEKMISEVESKFGNINILINNAGINRDAQFRKMTLEQWNAVMRTDLDGLFNVSRQVINKMCEQGFGRIINISSVSGQIGLFGQTNYAAAKAGVHGFTKSLAREVARYGITVNTISPGFIDSNMVKGIPQNIHEQLVQQTPVGRLGKPEEIAWAVGFLVDARSSFITGANLSVNGGINMY